MPTAPSPLHHHLSDSNERTDRRAPLLDDTDLCVKCAICLPHCPTYALARDESESPRGRITLMQGLLNDQLACSESVQQSLNNCLNCGRCERACPAQVPFTRLIDGVRAEFATEMGLDSRKHHATLLASSGRLKILAVLLRIAQRLRIATWPLIPAQWRRYLHFAGEQPDALVTSHEAAATSDQSTRVIMLAGCLNNAFEPDVAASVRQLAHHAGLTLEDPSPAQCCGALALHAGDRKSAQRTADTLMATYRQSDDPLVVLPSGCQRGVLDVLAATRTPEAMQLASRITDIYQLLYDALSVTDSFAPTSSTVSLYFPCTLANAERDSLLALLNLVPGAQIDVLNTPYGCCGAAGDHMLNAPAKSAQFAAPLVEQLTGEQASANQSACLLVPNTGCRWHLRAELRRTHSELPVWHPLQWLARRLTNSSHGNAKLPS